jgi:hypothetical protein
MNRPVEVLVHHRRGFADSHNVWEAQFAKSILRNAKRRNWKPTPKQTAIMDRLVGGLFNENDISVIED